MGITEIIGTIVGGILLAVNAYLLLVAADVQRAIMILALALIAGFDFGVVFVVILVKTARRNDS